MILSDDSSSPSSLFTCGKLYYSFFFAAFFLPQLLLLGFHSSLREMINKIVISTDGNIGITRKGIKAFGKKNCPSVPLVVGIHLWDRWKSLKVEARVREARYCVRAGNGMKQLPTDWSFSPPVSCAITLANSPAGNFNGYNWNRKTGRLPLVHAPPPPLLRIRNYPILRRGYKFRTSRERWEEKRGEKSLALNYFQSDLVVKGVEENFADWTIPFWERFRSICPLWISPSIFPCRHLVCENNWRKLVVFFQGCCLGKFLLEKCWKGGQITEDIGIRSDDVEGCFGEEGIPRNYEGKIWRAINSRRET